MENSMDKLNVATEQEINEAQKLIREIEVLKENPRNMSLDGAEFDDDGITEKQRLSELEKIITKEKIDQLREEIISGLKTEKEAEFGIAEQGKQERQDLFTNTLEKYNLHEGSVITFEFTYRQKEQYQITHIDEEKGEIEVKPVANAIHQSLPQQVTFTRDGEGQYNLNYLVKALEKNI
jgi:hypothetical protein